MTNKVYRYKFADNVVEELSRFSLIHRDDDRTDFKEAWKVWLEEQNHLVEEEIKRLKAMKYEGDVVDKMFKSARYYFRKKSTVKKEPSERREYVSVSKDILITIDRHIQTNMDSNNYTPAIGFDEFCSINKDLLTTWIQALRTKGFDIKEVQEKIKKTYKNRYYVIRTNKQVEI